MNDNNHMPCVVTCNALRQGDWFVDVRVRLGDTILWYLGQVAFGLWINIGTWDFGPGTPSTGHEAKLNFNQSLILCRVLGPFKTSHYLSLRIILIKILKIHPSTINPDIFISTPRQNKEKTIAHCRLEGDSCACPRSYSAIHDRRRSIRRQRRF